MRIVYCIAATYNSGGMERVLSCKANYWAEQGHDVFVITTDQQERASFFNFHPRIQFIDLGVNYEENNGKSFFNKVWNFPKKQRLHKRRLSQALHSLKADIVVSMFNNEVNFLYAITDGSKKVLEIHFSKNKKLLYNRKGLWRLADIWRTRQEEQLVRRYDRFVTLTQEDAVCWGDTGNLEVIPNPRTFVPQTTSSLGSNVVLTIGRYEYQKGFDRLIDAWAKVDATLREHWKLRLVGEGQDAGALQKQIENLGLERSVELIAPHSNVEPFFQAASIFAMTSRYEGLPMVLLEAQACGLPIVAYDFQCGPKDIIEEGISGFIIQEGDAQTFAEKLSLLMRNETLRKEMGEKAVANSTHYSVLPIMKRWEALFANLLA